MQNEPILLFALIAMPWLFLSSIFSRHTVWFLLLWVPIQGWIQLNLFSDSALTVLLYEFQIIGIYLVFLYRAMRAPDEFAPPRVVWLALPIAVWTIVLTPFSVASGGMLRTLIGLRTLLLPLPLVWIGYRAFANRRQLENVSWALMVQMALIGLIATTQFVTGTSMTNDVGRVEAGYVAIGVMRPPGTFSSPGHFGMYVLMAMLFAMGLLGLKVPMWKRIGFAIGLAGATIGLVVNTQRATMVLLMGTIPLVVLFGRKTRVLRMAVIAVCVVAAGFAIGLRVVGDAFVERFTSIVDSSQATLVDAPIARMSDALRTSMWGVGLGMASPGTQRVDVPVGRGSALAPREGADAESFLASLVYETGVIGMLLFVFYVAALMRLGWRAMQQCRGGDMGLLAAAIFFYQLAICLQSWSYDPLHYPPSRVMFWFWAGVLMRLPALQTQIAAVAQPAVARLTPQLWRQAPRPAAATARASGQGMPALGSRQ
jgi:hypothetical protein